MDRVKPKKKLGQHFLTDPGIASKIVDSLGLVAGYNQVLEIGPGTGILTQRLIERKEFETTVMDIDSESVDHLIRKYPDHTEKILEGDILKADLNSLFGNHPFAIVGNLPYNISSQIFFRVLDLRNLVPEMVCMVQREVGERLASGPGSKKYGILSVLLQAYYDVRIILRVKPGSFYPPPKVHSAVLHFSRNETSRLECNEDLFFKVVKRAFQNRRKTLRNALKGLNLPQQFPGDDVLSKRAEELTIPEFIKLTNHVAGSNNV